MAQAVWSIHPVQGSVRMGLKEHQEAFSTQVIGTHPRVMGRHRKLFGRPKELSELYSQLSGRYV
jgi:hypothetical protein